VVGRERFELSTFCVSGIPETLMKRDNSRTELSEIEDVDQIVNAFGDFCRIDMHRSDRTVENNSYWIRRFFNSVKKNPREVSDQDVREYLRRYRDSPANTYANILKAFKAFFRDFMRMPWIVESFRFPNRPFHPKTVPSKEQLSRFYYALNDSIAETMFLVLASTGLRKNEVLSLRIGDIDLEKRTVIPRKGYDGAKNTWITFLNEEAAQTVGKYLASLRESNPENDLFKKFETRLKRAFKKAYQKTGIHITAQLLREWFACEMGKLGVPDRYVDAFCGRVPRSVLARHYTDFSPERLKEVYDKAGLRVLD